MKQKGKDILEICLTVRGFDKKEFADWMADGRRQHREYSLDDWADWCDNNREEYERILSSAKLVVEKRLKEAYASAYTQDVDDMIDAEMRRQKDGLCENKHEEKYTHIHIQVAQQGRSEH